MQEMTGREVACHVFGLRTVRIYANGYVRVGLLGAFRAPLERLISIAAAADLPSTNGRVYLTIVTDRKTHELEEHLLASANLRAAMALDEAGHAVLESAARR
jgi:hypothetical protein